MLVPKFLKIFVSSISISAFEHWCPAKTEERFKVYDADKNSGFRRQLIRFNQLKSHFQKKGADILIKQIMDLGSTKPDDLADAFMDMCLKIIEKDGEPQLKIRFI